MVLVNYYILTFLLGIFLMAFTLFTGPVNLWVALAFVLLPLIACIIFQFKRHETNWYSIGEIVIGNNNKFDILSQTNIFSVTRIPVFLLLLFTIILNGNLLDGIGNGVIYSISNLILFVIIFLTTYNGIKNFLSDRILYQFWCYRQVCYLSLWDLKSIG